MSRNRAGAEARVRPLHPEVQRQLNESTVVERAVAIATRRWRLTPDEIDEATSVGQLALVRAAARFDPTLDVPLDGFAWDVVHFTVEKWARKERDLAKRARNLVTASLPDTARGAAAAVLQASRDPGDVLSDSDSDAHRHVDEFLDAVTAALISGYAQEAASSVGEDATIDRLDRERAKRLLRAKLPGLPDRDARLLRLRYFESAGFEAIAEDLGESEASARRHHLSAIDRLAKRMRSASP